MKDEYKEMLCRVRFIDGVYAQTYLSDVEIVRCRDCKYGSPNGVYGCVLERFNRLDKSERMYSNDYCSRAEREEE